MCQQLRSCTDCLKFIAVPQALNETLTQAVILLERVKIVRERDHLSRRADGGGATHTSPGW